MAKEPLKVSLEDARALVTLAESVWKRKPWETLENEDIFAIEDEALGGLWAVGVMGAAKEVFGINFYAGTGGVELLSFLIDGMFDDPDEQFECWADLGGFSLEFVPADELEGGSREFLRAAGLTVRAGRRLWPEFRRLRPNRPPCELRGDEAGQFAGLLGRFFEAYGAIEEDPDLIAWDSLGLDSEVSGELLDFMAENPDPEEMVRRLVETVGEGPEEPLPFTDGEDEDGEIEDPDDEIDFPRFPVWRGRAGDARFERVDLQAPSAGIEQLEFPLDVRGELRRRMNLGARGVWEIGAIFVGIVNQDGESGEPAYGEAIVVVDGETGMVLNAQPGLRMHRSRNLADGIIAVLRATDVLPNEILCDHDGFYPLLLAFGEDYGIEVNPGITPLLGEALEDLRQHLGA
jgi:hypothetical protein